MEFWSHPQPHAKPKHQQGKGRRYFHIKIGHLKLFHAPSIHLGGGLGPSPSPFESWSFWCHSFCVIGAKMAAKPFEKSSKLENTSRIPSKLKDLTKNLQCFGGYKPHLPYTKLPKKIAWEYPLSKRGLWDFEQHSDFICHWQKTRNWQKNSKINSKFTKNLEIKLEIYKNLEIKLEIYSYFKLENKLEIFEFFVNGRWS